MTLHEKFVASGANAREIGEAEMLLAMYLPLERAVVITDEIVAAALAGDNVLVLTLLAPEDDPTEEELEALRELEEGPASDRELIQFELSDIH